MSDDTNPAGPQAPRRSGPVLFDLSERAEPAAETPDTAPPVPEGDGREPAMQTLAVLAGRSAGGGLRGWFMGLFAAVLTAFGGIAAWAAFDALLARSQILADGFMVLIGAFVLVCLGIILRELAALSRLGRLSEVHKVAMEVVARDDAAAARKLSARLSRFYAARSDLKWSSEGLEARVAEAFDADAILAQTERALILPLDQRAQAEIEAAARQVATVTALVPLALADVFTALTANLRMIRRIAEIYGGRAGTLGSWRLLRAVLTHLVATGAVAVGDDLIHSVAGGTLLSRVSRRFGEGLVNAALTARVGVAAIEVCRPLPFAAGQKPSVSGVISRALAGMIPAPAAKSPSKPE